MAWLCQVVDFWLLIGWKFDGRHDLVDTLSRHGLSVSLVHLWRSMWYLPVASTSFDETLDLCNEFLGCLTNVLEVLQYREDFVFKKMIGKYIPPNI